MADYKLQEFVFNKLSKTHIPYCIGALVIGPRNGRYFLDLFNLETLIKEQYGLRYAYETKIINIARETNKLRLVNIRYSSEKELISAVKKQYNCVFICRKSGLEKTATMIGNIII